MNTTSPDSPVFSENDGEEVHDEDHLGDYSARFEELMSDEDEQSGHANGHDDAGEDEAFFYSGVDAEPSMTYCGRLRGVLGLEHEGDSVSEQEVECSMTHDVSEKEQFETAMDDEARPADASSPSRSEFLSPQK